MKNSIRYFIAQAKYNLKNAHALARSFWTGVISMILNNLTFFIIWFLFMQATGPINGWTTIDVFGMLGISMFAFGFAQSFFYGITELPQLVVKGSFDSVLLAPVTTFFKLAGSAFSITAYGDLLQGTFIVILYGIFIRLTLVAWIVYVFTIFLGCIIFICIRLLCSLVVFFIHDGEVVSGQIFDIFLRPGLYPGSIFPSGLKLFFMTIIPTLLTSAVPIYFLKSQSTSLFLLAVIITLFWVLLTSVVFRMAIRRYESGNYLR